MTVIYPFLLHEPFLHSGVMDDDFIGDAQKKAEEIFLCIIYLYTSQFFHIVEEGNELYILPLPQFIQHIVADETAAGRSLYENNRIIFYFKQNQKTLKDGFNVIIPFNQLAFIAESTVSDIDIKPSEAEPGRNRRHIFGGFESCIVHSFVF